MNKITLKDIEYDIDNDIFFKGVLASDFVRYLKGIYRNKERFKNNFIDYFVNGVKMYDRPDRIENIEILLDYYDEVEPFSYKEAFEISDDRFKAVVFGSINITEMIESLGSERIDVQGKRCNHRVYNEDGSYKMSENDLIYELHKVSLKNLGVEGHAYAVKCWCTSTNKEHWLWVNDEYANKGALEAIASTCMVYEDMIPHIKSLKRQGDIFLFEMTKKMVPKGELVSLTADQYFKFLVSQS